MGWDSPRRGASPRPVGDTETLIRAYFEAFNRHDLEGMLSALAEDVVHDINEGDREVGKEAFRCFKTRMDRCYVEQISDLVVMTSGERGAAEFTCSGRYVGTDDGLPEARGQEYSIAAAAFFEVSAGKIARVTSYYSLAGWLRAISSE